MITTAVTGALAGVLMGYVLQRGQLCFHSAIRTSLEGGFVLARGWALGVSPGLGVVGLAVLFLLPGTSGLNQGLAFRPVEDVAGWTDHRYRHGRRASHASPGCSTSWAQACSAPWSD